jgi:hypothetical protein
LDLDIDDWVEEWHETGGAPMGSAMSLAEYLGMSSREYDLWVEEPAALRVLIAAHRQNLGVEELLKSRTKLALAARSAADRDAVSSLIRWLVERGDLPDGSVAELLS